MAEMEGLPSLAGLHPVVAILIALIFAMFTVGGRGFVLGLMEQKQKEKVTNVEVADQVKNLFDEMIADVKAELARVKEELEQGRSARKELEQDLAEEREHRLTLGRDLEDARRKLDDITAENHRLHESNVSMFELVKSVRRNLAEYEGRTMQLTAILNAHGIEVPPWTMLPGEILNNDEMFGFETPTTRTRRLREQGGQA